jgi:hypothetical protein
MVRPSRSPSHARNGPPCRHAAHTPRHAPVFVRSASDPHGPPAAGGKSRGNSDRLLRSTECNFLLVAGNTSETCIDHIHFITVGKFLLAREVAVIRPCVRPRRSACNGRREDLRTGRR